MIHLVAYGLPILVAALTIPMILGIVPPNGLYGFRTSKTLSSPDICYPANRVSGWLMVAAMAVEVAFNLTLWSIHPDWPIHRLLVWMTMTTLVAVLTATAASCFYLRKL